jgi:acyl carrier protein
VDAAGGGGDGMNGDILTAVRGVAADVFAVDPKTLDAASSPEHIEAWDSVQHLNLVLALEGKYGIQFAPEEMEHMQNLGEIAQLLETKIA